MEIYHQLELREEFEGASTKWGYRKVQVSFLVHKWTWNDGAKEKQGQRWRRKKGLSM
jgi:hypothetical protein